MADLAPPVVLVVDDNDDTRAMYGHLLRSAGFEVKLAADGDEALAAAGCDAFVSKPCAIEELVAAVRRLLAR